MVVGTLAGEKVDLEGKRQDDNIPIEWAVRGVWRNDSLDQMMVYFFFILW